MASEAQPKTTDPRFLLFSGTEGRAPLRLESFHALGYACRRMKQRAKEEPGFYFVCCLETQEILASEDKETGRTSKGKTAGGVVS